MDEGASALVSVADSPPVEVSVASLLAGPVVVTLVTKVEPLEVNEDSVTPVVRDPDSVPEAPDSDAAVPVRE